MLITVGGIKIMYSSKLLTIKLENFQDSEKIYELTAVYYELLYWTGYSGGYYIRLIKYNLETWNLYLDT